MKNIRDLKQRAQSAIDNSDFIALETATDHNHLLGEVRNETWFLYSLMIEITKEEEEFSHLTKEALSIAQ